MKLTSIGQYFYARLQDEGLQAEFTQEQQRVLIVWTVPPAREYWTCQKLNARGLPCLCLSCGNACTMCGTSKRSQETNVQTSALDTNR